MPVEYGGRDITVNEIKGETIGIGTDILAGGYGSSNITVNQGWAPVFSKERNVLAFFPVLYNRTKRSLRSFPFFIKERDDLCVLSRSLQKNGTFFTFFSVLLKRTGKNVPFFWVS